MRKMNLCLKNAKKPQNKYLLVAVVSAVLGYAASGLGCVRFGNFSDGVSKNGTWLELNCGKSEVSDVHE